MGDDGRQVTGDRIERDSHDAVRALFLAEARLDAIQRSAEYQLACRARNFIGWFIPRSGPFRILRRAVRKTLEICLNEGPAMLWARAVSKVSRSVQSLFRRSADRQAAAATREDVVRSVVRLSERKAARGVRSAAAVSARLPAEINHLLGQFCQSCRHFDGSACSLMKSAGDGLRRQAFERALADPLERCPAGLWGLRVTRPVTRLNLVYHVTPIRHPDRVWQWNVGELLKRLHHFNGRRIITVVKSSGGRTMDPPEVVAAEFAGHDVELRFAPNDPELREGRHFVSALREIASTDPAEAVFYAHAKGVSHLDQRIVRPWTAALYHHNLDRIDEVRELLGRWPCVGIAKRRGEFVKLSFGQPRKPGSLLRRPWHGWHYSGTFWWARHDKLFSRPDWDQIPRHAFAVEGYLANFFRPEDAVCLAYEDIPDPYNLAIWQDVAA
ncbi:MAG: hypothetical protein HY290_26920 [Planctomycetia bacterium]|nr:hypothetical protein [Planctomycetia bacterium]